jgi:Na+/H+-dicarboxylate symporter
MKKLALHWKIIIGLILGVVWAYLSSNFGWAEVTKDWLAPFGTIFINLLKLIAVPLVMFSIMSGITGLSDVTKLGRMGGRTLLIYLLTTVLAVSLGLALVNVIKPGEILEEKQRIEKRLGYEKWAEENGKLTIDGLDFTSKYGDDYEAAELVMDEATKAKVEKKKEVAKKTKDSGPLQFLIDMVPNNIFISLGNNGLMLQVIFFAIFFGVTLTLVKSDKVKSVILFIEGANEVFLKMIDVVMKAAPFFVFALMASKMSEIAGDDPNKLNEMFIALGYYSLVVIIGLAIMIFGFYASFKVIVVNRPKSISSFFKGYGQFFSQIGKAQMLAFSTSSSAATLPVTMDCVHENMGVDKNVSSFVLPIGATVNMDGTSLYQAVAVVFLAQYHYIDLDLMQQLTIVLTATLASIGSAAVPGAGLVMLMIVLGSLDLNPAWIAIILPIDRLLDMCRTVVNVTGDATVSAVIAKSEGQIDMEKNA